MVADHEVEHRVPEKFQAFVVVAVTAPAFRGRRSVDQRQVQQGAIAEADAELGLELDEHRLPPRRERFILAVLPAAGSLLSLGGRGRRGRHACRPRSRRNLHRQIGLRSTKMALCPPNPKAFDIATSTGAGRGAFGM